MVVLRYYLDLFIKDFPQFDGFVCKRVAISTCPFQVQGPDGMPADGRDSPFVLSRK